MSGQKVQVRYEPRGPELVCLYDPLEQTLSVYRQDKGFLKNKESSNSKKKHVANLWPIPFIYVHGKYYGHLFYIYRKTLQCPHVMSIFFTVVNTTTECSVILNFIFFNFHVNEKKHVKYKYLDIWQLSRIHYGTCLSLSCFPTSKTFFLLLLIITDKKMFLAKMKKRGEKEFGVFFTHW